MWVLRLESDRLQKKRQGSAKWQWRLVLNNFCQDCATQDWRWCAHFKHDVKMCCMKNKKKNIYLKNSLSNEFDLIRPTFLTAAWVSRWRRRIWMIRPFHSEILLEPWRRAARMQLIWGSVFACVALWTTVGSVWKKLTIAGWVQRHTQIECEKPRVNFYCSASCVTSLNYSKQEKQTGCTLI